MASSSTRSCSPSLYHNNGSAALNPSQKKAFCGEGEPPDKTCSLGHRWYVSCHTLHLNFTCIMLRFAIICIHQQSLNPPATIEKRHAAVQQSLHRM